MKLKPFSLMLTAALLAFSLLADDGPYVVIERTYYEQCKNSFDSQCNYLYEQVGALFRGWSSELTLIENQNNGYVHTISLALAQIDSARSDLDLTDPDQVEADTHLQSARNSLISLEDNISRNNDLISQWINELIDAKTDLQNHVIATSNSFPYAVATTNLNIYIIVTNSFEAATNNYCCCTNEFEHFLNYFQDVESQVLDQYRNTVTNLLNWSEFSSWIDYSFWNTPSYVSASWHNKSYNFAWWSIPWDATLGYGIIFDSGAANVARWQRFAQTLPTDANFADWLAFNIQGIHDSVEYGAKSILQVQHLLNFASTNSQMTLTFDASQTNQMAQFLSAPATYEEQLSKISRTRNWFQRIEHWMSSIARNTNPVEIEVESVESQEGLKNDVENATNELQTAAIGIKDSFNVLPPLTNTTAALDGAVQSCSRILNSFRSSGGRRSASSAPADFRLMKSEFISTTFERLGLPENENLPYYIGADADTPGFEHVQSASTWLHHIFGFIWLCGGLALLVYYARWLSSWVVTLWYRMLGMLVKISKFTWGST